MSVQFKFDEISVKAKKQWTDSTGKKRQQTKKFWQTFNPFNKNQDGSIKTREQILKELEKERDDWLTDVEQ